GTARYAPRAAAYTSSVFNTRTGTPVVPLRILLIGWSDIAYDILLELNAHVTSGTTVTVLASPERSGVDAKLSNDVAATLTKLKVDLRRGDAAERSAYENLDLASYDTIVVLADEAAGNGDSDSHALRISLRLSALVDQTGAQANIVVELLDAANRDLYRGLGIRDLVVSSDIISAQLAQITQQEVLGSIYRELLSAGGVEISLRAAVEYVIADTPCRFEDLIFAAQKNSEIALGLSLDSGEVLLNPSRKDVWQLGEHDKLIVLAQQIYR
ncbi:MAG: NAD-binding protein, partial [Gammaproteobacteria bacterium]|nr:NAD-binding protein [Gammaproteobacteria bacterium]